MIMDDRIHAPQIRFSGFSDDWKQRRLGEVAKYRNGKAHENSISKDGKYVVVNSKFVSTDGEIRKFSNEQIEPLYKGEIAFVLSDVPNGRAIARTFLVDESGKYTLNQRIASISPNENTDSYFLHILMNRNKYFLRFDDGNKQTNLSVNDVIQFEERYPSYKEQHNIGEYFKALDHLITLHQCKLDKLMNIKKSMLEKMFVEKNTDVPEIRFSGFTDAWEQRKLGEVCNEFDYGLNVAAKEYDGINKYLRITDIDDDSREFNFDNLTSPDISNNEITDEYLLRNGDILFARTGASVGKTYLYKELDGKVYFAGFLIRAHVGIDNYPYFIFQTTLTEAYAQFVKVTSQRSGQPGINAKEYSKYKIYIPKYFEQQMIGTLFEKLDKLITLHQRKLEKLKNIKTFCLEKMFV